MTKQRTRPVLTTAHQALAELQAAGFRYVGTELPDVVPVLLKIPAVCTVCGSRRTLGLHRVREGRRCQHRFPAPDVVVKWAAEAGFTPREPYPGSRKARWKLACAVCSTPHSATLSRLLAGHTCPCAERVKEFRAAGYEPQVPYPGTLRKPWPSVCLSCGGRRTPSVNTVRSGKRCLHRNPVRITSSTTEPTDNRVSAPGGTPHSPAVLRPP